MPLDSSLAYGLAKRFTRENHERFSNLESQGKFCPRPAKKMQYYQKFFSRFAFDPFIAFSVVGSNARPVLLSNYLVLSEEFNDLIDDGHICYAWQSIDLTSLRRFSHKFPLYFVRYHAIQRIIQRKNLHYDPKDFGKQILCEFRFAAILSSIFSFVLRSQKLSPDQLNSLSMMIPAESGVLLCRLRKSSVPIITTFVHINMLTTAQKHTRDMLIKIFAPFQASRANFWHLSLAGSSVAQIFPRDLLEIALAQELAILHFCENFPSFAIYDLMLFKSEFSNVEQYELFQNFKTILGSLVAERTVLSDVLKFFLENGEDALFSEIRRLNLIK